MQPQDPPQQPTDQFPPSPPSPTPPSLPNSPNTNPYPPSGTVPQMSPPSPAPPNPLSSGYTAPQPTPPARSGKKYLILGAVLVLLIAVGSGVVLVARSSKPSSKAALTAASTTTSAKSAIKSNSPAASPSSSEQKTALDQSVKTPLGFTITATQLVTNFPVTQASQVSSGYEPVLVDVSVASDGSYAGATPSGFDFALLSGGATYTEGTAPRSNGDYVADSDVTAAGFSAYDDATSNSSGGQSGYLLFIVPKNASSFTLQYNEPQETVYGSNSTIPAKSVDLPL